MRSLKVLLVVADIFDFYVYQMAHLLRQAGHEVHILHRAGHETEPVFADLLQKAQAEGFITHIIHDRTSWISRKVRSAMFRGGLHLKRSFIPPSIISQSRRLIADCAFDWVVAFQPLSVYLACQLFPRHPEKIIDYSLEVVEETNPDYQRWKPTRMFIAFERQMLPRLGALMIQDSFRADILLKPVPGFSHKRIIQFPVAVSGPPVTSNAVDYFQEQLPDRSKRRVLFFGGLWNEPILTKLRSVAQKLPDTQVLIIQGGRGTVNLAEETSPRLLISRKSLKFDQLTDMISSADIGLALYHGNDLNHQFTAYSSEKIARYTQCGLPFIAFRQGNYEHLRAETGCCELISDLDELPQAIETILRDYEKYRAAAFDAYERHYRLENTSRELLSFLHDNATSNPT